MSRIPHFGNDVPYTTANEDRIAALEAELEELKGASRVSELED